MDPIIDLLYPQLRQKLDKYPVLPKAIEQRMISENFNIDLLREMWKSGLATVDHVDKLRNFVTQAPNGPVREREVVFITLEHLSWRSTLYKNQRPDGKRIFEWKFSNDGFFYSPYIDTGKQVQRERKGTKKIWQVLDKMFLKAFESQIDSVIDWTKKPKNKTHVVGYYCAELMCLEVIIEVDDIEWTITFEPGFPEQDSSIQHPFVKYSEIQKVTREQAIAAWNPESALEPKEKRKGGTEQKSKRTKL